MMTMTRRPTRSTSRSYLSDAASQEGAAYVLRGTDLARDQSYAVMDGTTPRVFFADDDWVSHFVFRLAARSDLSLSPA